MIKEILIPIDGSEITYKSIEFAAGMAKSMILGISSVLIYATSIHFLYPLCGILWGSILAYALSLSLTLIIFRFRFRIR